MATNFDPKTMALALLGLVLRHMDPEHQQSTTQQVVGAAHDILDAAQAEITRREQSHTSERGPDGLTQAERDAGWTPEMVLGRATSQLPQLPAIAVQPGNDQLAVLAALHADADIVDELRAELAANPDQGGALFAQLAEHYAGVANEMRAYVTHPDRDRAAAAAGGAQFLHLVDDAAPDAQARRELAELHASGQVTDRTVPGDYIPPDTARDTSGDPARIAEAVAAQDAGREAFNLAQADAPAGVHAIRSETQPGPDSRVGFPGWDNREVSELAAAPQLVADDAGQIRELDTADGGTIQQDTSGGAIQEHLTEGEGGTIQDDQGAASAPQQ